MYSGDFQVLSKDLQITVLKKISKPGSFCLLKYYSVPDALFPDKSKARDLVLNSRFSNRRLRFDVIMFLF